MRVPCAIQSIHIPRPALCMPVVLDDHVDGGVELDAGHFRAGELPLGPDVVDVVVRDLAEDGAQASADAGLLAVEDGVVATMWEPIFSRDQPASSARTMTSL